MMKFLALFLLAGCLQLSAKMDAQMISLSLTNGTLSAAFNEIQQQTPYRFVYTSEQLAGTRKLTLSVQNSSIEKVLEICFKDQPLTYKIEDKFIIVEPKGKKADKLSAENDVKGKVTNEKDEPIVGASIRIKGTQKGTATNGKGEFVLPDVTAGSVLVFSSIGYEAKEIIIGNNRFLNIQLSIAASALDETVVKGYYSTSRQLNTGSVSKITSEEIGNQPVENVVAAMEGRVPGLYIAQQSGVTGGNFTIRIRGRNSISAGNEPLYIIDGVPFTSTSLSSTTLSSGITRQGSPLNSISPADIENIEILKDADATAIYGSRGANGVILITTKKGKAGKTNFDANIYTGVAKVAHFMDLLDTQQYLAMRHEAFNNDGATPQGYDVDVNGVWDSTRNTNWQKVLIGGTAKITDVQASVSGGNATTTFALGGGFHHESTVFPGKLGSQRGSGHFSLQHVSSNQKLTLQLSSNYSIVTSTLPQSDLTYTALNLPPDAPALYNAAGQLNWENSTWANPLSYLLQTYKSTTNNFLTRTLLGYKILPSLDISISAGFTKMDMSEIAETPISSWPPAYGVTSGSSLFSSGSIETWILEPQINWNKTIGKGLINLLLGTTLQENSGSNTAYSATGYVNDALLQNMQAASVINVTNNAHTDYRYNAIYGRAGYTWLSKYILNLTARRDGSSRFGPGKQFVNFGSAGAAWIFSKEKFMEHALPFISYGKLRATYGITGSDQIPDYGYLETYSPTTYPYQGISGLYPTNLFNPDYEWEINKKTDVAFEIGFFHNAIILTMDYYHNKSSNQLVGYPLAPTTGFSALPYYNLPATVVNTGFEFEMNTINIKQGKFSWTSSINLTIPRNKLSSYPGLASSTNAYRYVVGQPLTISKTFHLNGVNPLTGVFEFKDVDGDGALTFNDLQSVVNAAQQYYGGVQNAIIYKDFQINFLLQYVHQTGYDYFFNQLFVNPGNYGNQPVDVLSRWQKPGDVTSIQQFSQSSSSAAYTGYLYNSVLSDQMVTNASFIRLKNFSISYELHTSWLKKVHFLATRIYVEGQNLFTITNYRGIDPENNGNSRLAPLKVITGGLKLTI